MKIITFISFFLICAFSFANVPTLTIPESYTVQLHFPNAPNITLLYKYKDMIKMVEYGVKYPSGSIINLKEKKVFSFNLKDGTLFQYPFVWLDNPRADFVNIELLFHPEVSINYLGTKEYNKEKFNQFLITSPGYAPIIAWVHPNDQFPVFLTTRKGTDKVSLLGFSKLTEIGNIFKLPQNLRYLPNRNFR